MGVLLEERKETSWSRVHEEVRRVKFFHRQRIACVPIFKIPFSINQPHVLRYGQMQTPYFAKQQRGSFFFCLFLVRHRGALLQNRELHLVFNFKKKLTFPKQI